MATGEAEPGFLDRIKRLMRKRKTSAPLPELTILGLGPRQLYPEADGRNPGFLQEPNKRLLDRSTPVASIGSCFAREIKNYLQQRGFNYLQTASGPSTQHGSAAWDRIYNTFCLRQEFERALDAFEPAEPFWRLANGTLKDPYRKAITWQDEQAMAAELAEHRRCARRALTEARVVIVTVGLTEIWHSRLDGAVFYQVPPPDAFDPGRHAFRNSTLAENVQNLQRAADLLFAANPDCHLIITVSPVPLRATFQDQNVVISNALSKATLVVAAQTLVASHERIHYFPSYELVTAVIPDAMRDDNRHVKRETIEQIMKVFEANFVAEG